MQSLVETMMQSLGVAGIFLLMFAENVFPPIPSELIMPLAGYRASQDEMSITIVIVAGTAGSVAGIIPWYYLGKFLGKDRVKRLATRYGRWFTMSPEDVDRASLWFQDKGKYAVLFGRLVPAVRTLISVPAGVARMRFSVFITFSAAGSLIWTAALAMSGYLLGQNYQSVSSWVGPASNVILALIAAIYLYRVVTFQVS